MRNPDIDIGTVPYSSNTTARPLDQSEACLTAIQEVTFALRRGHVTFVEIGHKIISTAILSLPLNQVGQLTFTGRKMVNRLL